MRPTKWTQRWNRTSAEFARLKISSGRPPGITALLQLAIVLASGSIALLADTIHNFADAGTSIPLWIAFALARRGASRRFTYGYGKTEDVAGVLIVLIIFFSACVAAYEAVMKIIHPQPMTHLWWVAAAAVIGFLGNEAVAVFRLRVGRQIGSAALVADGQHARVDGFTSLAVLLGVVGVLLGFPIVDPIVGVGISIAILFIVKDAAAAVWLRLIDGIEPEILAEIEHAPTHVTGVESVDEVRARWVGHKVYTDVAVKVDPTISVRDADIIAAKVEQALRDHVRLLGYAVVRVSPRSKRDTASTVPAQIATTSLAARRIFDGTHWRSMLQFRSLKQHRPPLVARALFHRIAHRYCR